jgi:predicted RNA polymerase sigma factor
MAGAVRPSAARNAPRWQSRQGPVSEVDDTLTLLLLCCHPALDPASQIALTLRAVGTLSTA